METTKSEQLYLKTIYNLSLKMDYVSNEGIKIDIVENELR